MSDLSQELAALVADTLAAAESWRVTGAFLAPTGPLSGLPAAQPWPAGVGGRAPRGEAARTVGLEAAPVGGAPRGAAARTVGLGAARTVGVEAVPARGAPAHTVGLGAARTVGVEAVHARGASPVAGTAAVARAPALASEPPTAPAGGPNLAGLFGARWQQSIRNPEDEITDILTSAGPCPSCGAEARSLRGAGSAESRLAVVAAGPGGHGLLGDAGVMFDKMLVHVLALERGDVWVLEANACAAAGAPGASCRALLLRQLEIVGPRVLLAMGNSAAAILSVPAGSHGGWFRWNKSDVLTTFHPVDLMARPSDKGATMKHLTTLRQRL